MIQFKKDSSGLVEYASQIPFKTIDPKSVNYFRLYDFPDRFYLGKNAFRIAGNSDTLVKDSKIYIDIVDSSGGIIYHEVLDTVGQDNTRTVVVYIYSDTPPGPAKIYIGGRIYKTANTETHIPYNDNPSDVVNYRHVPNLLWVGDANVIPTKTNYEEVVYETEPTVEYTERIVNYVTPATHSRSVDRPSISGETVSMRSLSMPSQYGEYNSLYDDTDRMSVKTVSPSTLVTDNTGESVPKVQLPEYAPISVLRSNSDIFLSSMVGGTIRVNSISLASHAPNDVLNSSYFSVRPNYSASIVRVVNSRAIEVDPPFRYPLEYYTTDGSKRTISITNFTNHSNFTASYYSQDISTTTGSIYETFAEVEIKNLEPSIGTVDKISVSYKPIGSFGDFIDIGEYPVRSNNLLVDRSTLELSTSDGLSIKNIGEIKSSSDVVSYWTSSISGTGISSVNLSRRSTKILNSILVSCTGSFTESDYVVLYPRSTYSVGAISGTEYELSLSVDSSKRSGDWTSPLIDLYISGSDVSTDLIKSFDYTSPIASPSLGTHIGTISSKGGSIADYTFPFIVRKSSNIIPKIVVRSGEWDIGHINITPREERGFTPNHVKLNIPLPNLKRQSELILKFDYFNNVGVKSNIGTQVHGVIFSGSNDRGATLPSGLISSSRQFTSSMDPFTGSFSGSYQGDGTNLTGVVHNVGDLDFTSYSPFGMFYYDQTLSTIWASDDVLYDSNTKQFIIGETVDPSKFAIYPVMKSQIHVDDGYGPQRVFGIFNHTSELITYILDYQGTTQGIRNGINVETPNSTIDMMPGTEFSVATRADAVTHNTGSALGLYLSPTAIAGGEYYKILNMYSETGFPLITMVGQKNASNRNFLHIGVAKKEGGFGVVDETWLSLGDGKVYGTEFSGSGASLTNIPYSSIVNLPSIVSSSAQVRTLLPANTVSSSAQISTDISGAFNAASSSFSTRVYNVESKSTFTGSFSGSFTGDGTNLSLKANVVSSSAQISTDISGAFNAASSSFSTRVYNLESKSTFTGSFSGSFTGDGTNLSLKANVVSSSAQVDIRSASYSTYVTRMISYVTGHPIANQYYANSMFNTPQPVIFSSSAKIQNMDVSTEVVSSSYVKLPETGVYMCEWNVRIHEATGVVWVAALYGSMDDPSVIYSSSLFSSSIGNDNYINTRYIMTATSSATFVGLGVLFDNFTIHIPAQNQELDQSTFFVTQIKRGI